MSDNLKYMTGTTGTTYLQIGQMGDVGMGIRFYPLNCVNPAQVSDKTYFVVRVRIAKAEMMDDDDSSVINLGSKKSYSLSEAWPDMPREKQDDSRHSSFFGFYLDTNVHEDPEAFLQELYDGKFRSFCSKLIDLAGEHAIVESSDIQAFLGASLDPMAAQMLHVHQAKKTALETGDQPGFHVANYVWKDAPENEDHDVNPFKGALASVMTEVPEGIEEDDEGPKEESEDPNGTTDLT